MQQKTNELDYLKILEAICQIPFNVGKKLLIDFLNGDSGNESVRRNRLNQKELFGYFSLYEKKEIENLIENLLHNNLLEVRNTVDNKFIKILSLTEKGKKEIDNPTLHRKKLSSSFKDRKTAITENDRALFDAFDFFLKGYNEDQKKGIISNKEKILCIAGAGSGKTTVLTKRIEFLTAFRSVEQEKILAVTFTRKARTEMVSRLSKSHYCSRVNVETFNSFCEKIIRKYEKIIYNRSTRVVNYADRINIFKLALRFHNIEPQNAIRQYYTEGQRRDKTSEELIKSFMNDCFTVLETYKVNGTDIEELKKLAGEYSGTESINIEMIYRICAYIEQYMRKNGLRDYSDQLIDCIKFFKSNKELIPKFEHILIDEYQDVNSLQIELIDLLNAKSLFCVGDPRQSIFGWRGSKIKYILNFEDKYPDFEIITLNTNYRSSKEIVSLINMSLEGMKLPDLMAHMQNESEILLFNFDSEEMEMSFVTNKILDASIPRNEIFVLARTNRIITEFSKKLKVKQIPHILKTEDSNRDEEASNDEITLATVHSIKGLEAEMVFLLGCNSANFPCKASDHPVIELIKIEEYDKEEEERRLFYVALSRAKQKVCLTYSGKSHTRFISDKMLGLMKKKSQNKKIEPNYGNESDKLARLKMWRREISQKLNLPAYIIMHDSTLMEIVEMNPIDIEDLRNIRGMGHAKIERYGKEIMDVLNGRIN